MPPSVCVIGAGRWGTNHVRTLHALGCLGGIVDRNADALAALSREFPQSVAHANLKDAVADERFDGFTVATPAATHFEIARFLLEQRRPVLVEKPLALRAGEARQLCELAERSGTALMVGHLLLFHPAVRKIKELLDAGKIGKLQYLYSNRLNLGTVRTEENILWSFAPHDLSLFQHWIGRAPAEVVARGGCFVQPHIHDSTMLVLTYPENVVGHIFTSWLHPFKEHRVVAIGTKGMLSFEDSSTDKNILFYEKGIDWVQGEPIKRDGATETIPYVPALPLTEELRYFVHCLSERRPIERSTGREALAVLEILEQASQSLTGQNGKPAAPAAAPREKPAHFVHPTAIVDEGAEIGAGTRIWHFSHVQSHARIGAHCTLGQNVNVGNRVRARVVKNKVAPPFRDAEFDIMFTEGISAAGDLIDLAEKDNIVQKSGAWFSYGDLRLGQGRENAKQFLKDNADLFNEIRRKVLIKNGALPEPAAPIEKGEPDEETKPAGRVKK